MSEGESVAPKRVVRPRRRKVQPAESFDESSMREPGALSAQPLPPSIEDALDEVAAARAEVESSDESRPRTARKARPGRRRSLTDQVEEQSPPSEADMDFDSSPAPSASSPTPVAADTSSSSNIFDSANRDDDDAFGAGVPRNEGSVDRDGASSGDTFVGDDSRHRRRRRRGRGRGMGGPMNGDGGHNQQGSHGGGPQNRGQRGGRNQQQNRRGGGGGHQQNQRGPRTGGGRPQHQERFTSNEPRGPEVVTLVQGVLELHPKGYGFLRDPKAGYVSQDSDPFVSGTMIEKMKIREGVLITGECISGGRGQGPRLKSIQTVEGRMPEQYLEIKNFDVLTPINPHQQIKLETGPTPITMRVMDLLTPIGKGQRALLVAPPRSGKTMLLQEIADAVSKNHPEIYLIVLLIDERPEEVTEMRRRVHGEVVASSLDREVENHIRVSQLVFERAKRMAESGRDVLVLLDSITRTARAFNKWTNTGRTGTGGLDVKAMDIPKKMFGMARQFDEGGSLTVIGTALIETGGRMDDAIFQEFKGTGNMEMMLSRELAERRIWPAIDIARSGTRRDEKILSPETLDGVTLLRRSLVSMGPVEAMEMLTKTLAKYPSNAEFIAKIRAIM